MDSKKTSGKMRNISRKVPAGEDKTDLSLKRSISKKSVKSFKEYADHIKSEIEQSKRLSSIPFNNFESLGGRQSLRTSTSNSCMKLRYGNGIEGNPENNPKSSMSNISIPSRRETRNYMEDGLDLRPSTSKASLAYRKQCAANNFNLKPGSNQLSYGRSEGVEDDKHDLTVLMRNLSFCEAMDTQDELDLRPSTSKASMNAVRCITGPAENKIRTQRSVSTTGLNSRISGLHGFPLCPGIPNEKPHSFSATKLKTLESFPLKKDHNFKEMSKLLDKCNTQMEKIRSSELESYILDQNLFNLQTEFLMKREKFNNQLIESRKQEPEE